MKYINFYKKKSINKEDVFDNLINTLRSSIKVWDYFVNWDKVNSNIGSIKVELNLLNSLLDSKNFEEDFIKLLMEYPNIVKALPVLIAVRESELEILKDYKNKDLDYLTFDFTKQEEISEIEAKKYFLYIKKSGILELFRSKKIKNLVDYVLGVEVGLDSNGRKNRGGFLMEEIVEVFVKEATERNKDLEFLPQATPKKIFENWGYEVDFDKSARSFDFAVYNKKTKKLFLIETNFYNGGGSKLKAVCGEFRYLANELKEQGIDLIWVSDGKGWLTTKRPFEETFNNNDYVFNLNLLEDGILDDILNS